MSRPNDPKFESAVFLTFSGNCKQALTFYQNCFGGKLHFDTLEKELEDYAETPVVCGSLISESIVIHGSDLVHNEGRLVGNYMAIFIHCTNIAHRKALVQELAPPQTAQSINDEVDQKLLEIIDAFEVRWVLGV